MIAMRKHASNRRLVDPAYNVYLQDVVPELLKRVPSLKAVFGCTVGAWAESSSCAAHVDGIHSASMS